MQIEMSCWSLKQVSDVIRYFIRSSIDMQPELSTKEWHFHSIFECFPRDASVMWVPLVVDLSGEVRRCTMETSSKRNESDLPLSTSSDIYACSNKSVSHCTWSSELFVENAREHKLITVNSLIQSRQFVRITSRSLCLIISKIVYQSDTSIMCSDGVCSFFSSKRNFCFDWVKRNVAITICDSNLTQWKWDWRDLLNSSMLCRVQMQYICFHFSCRKYSRWSDYVFSNRFISKFLLTNRRLLWDHIYTHYPWSSEISGPHTDDRQHMAVQSNASRVINARHWRFSCSII